MIDNKVHVWGLVQHARRRPALLMASAEPSPASDNAIAVDLRQCPEKTHGKAQTTFQD